jgi:GTPase SAR1 family protein
MIYHTRGEHANYYTIDTVWTDVLVSMYWFGLFFTGLINKKCNLLIIGLDNAGKSTLLSRISNGRLVQHLPTSKVCKYIICFYLFWTTNKHLRQVLCNPQWIGCVRNSKRTVLQNKSAIRKKDETRMSIYDMGGNLDCCRKKGYIIGGYTGKGGGSPFLNKVIDW